MQFFDTHAHWDDAYTKGTFLAQLQAATIMGVTQVAIPNCNAASLPDVVAAAAAQPSKVFAMCGLHPTYITAAVEEELALLKASLFAPNAPFIAVGEIGLDLYWKKDNLPQQQKVLETQLQWAADLGLPVALHSREALQPCLEVVAGFKGGIHGVFHCFSGSEAEAAQITDLGFFLGIGGNITYKSNQTLSTLQQIGLGHVVLETDSPYLAPMPYRGKLNEPAHVRLIAEFLAQHLRLPLEEVAKLTTNNAHTLFKHTAPPAA